MTHVDRRGIAEHLAGVNATASDHIATCEDCRARAAATLMVASCIGTDEEPPGSLRAATHIQAALAHAATQREEDPAGALRTAQEALAALDELTLPSALASALRAAAWREIANCHRYLGTYPAALAALDAAESAVDGVAAGAYEAARIGFTRATVLWKMGADASLVVTLATEAARVFREHGDELRALHAMMLIGGVHFVAREYERATAVFQDAAAHPDAAADALTCAELHHNLGACYQALENHLAAAEHFQEALALYEHLGMHVEALRTHWLLGLMSLRTGREDDGRTRLTHTARAFMAMGNAPEGALVLIDLAEHLITTGCRDEARAVLREIDRRAVGAYAAAQLTTLNRITRAPEALRQLHALRLSLAPRE